MAHKVYRGVRELFFLHKSFPVASLQEWERRRQERERERGCAHWKGGSGWKREAPFSELLPIFSLPWDQLGSATERVPVNA